MTASLEGCQPSITGGILISYSGPPLRCPDEVWGYYIISHSSSSSGATDTRLSPYGLDSPPPKRGTAPCSWGLLAFPR